MNELKSELKEHFPINPPKDDDGLFSKQFMLDLHTLLYKYKKMGSELLGESNFH